MIHGSIGNGYYDAEYIEAVLCEDTEEIDRIEVAAEALGYGPLTICTTVSNFSLQKAFCREYSKSLQLMLVTFTEHN